MLTSIRNDDDAVHKLGLGL